MDFTNRCIISKMTNRKNSTNPKIIFKIWILDFKEKFVYANAQNIRVKILS